MTLATCQEWDSFYLHRIVDFFSCEKTEFVDRGDKSDYIEKYNQKK